MSDRDREDNGAQSRNDALKPAPGQAKGRAGREERLAEALRANLRRRKAAAARLREEDPD